MTFDSDIIRELMMACKNLLELSANVQDHDLADVIRAEAKHAIEQAEQAGYRL